MRFRPGLALSRPTLLNLPASLGPRGGDNGHGSDGPPGDGKDQEYRKRILSRIQLIFTHPYAAALLLLILGTVLGGLCLIGGLVFTALQYSGKF